jgi:hypothetical protein
MKLNPEDIEIVSFPTDPGADAQPVVSPTVDTDLPTPQTYCFVCD